MKYYLESISYRYYIMKLINFFKVFGYLVVVKASRKNVFINV